VPTDPAILILQVLGFDVRDYDLLMALGDGCRCEGRTCQLCHLRKDKNYLPAFKKLYQKGILTEDIELTEEGRSIFNGIRATPRAS
jgi:hypothetical protein